MYQIISPKEDNMYGYRHLETMSKRCRNVETMSHVTLPLNLFLPRRSSVETFSRNYSPEIGLVGSRIIISISFSGHARRRTTWRWGDLIQNKARNWIDQIEIGMI